MIAIYGHHIETYYHRLRAMGLVRNRRDYGRRWLGRAPTYMHDLAAKARQWRAVSSVTIQHLRDRLAAIADFSPPGPAAEVRAVLAQIDQDVAVAAILRAGRR